MWRRLRYMLSPQLDLYESIAPHLAGQKVLEVGFGTGVGTLQLAQHAKVITAFEVELEAVEFAERVFPLHSIVWCMGDVLALTPQPFYDAVVMVEVLEHVPEWQAALQNVVGVLKEGGKLYISARNRFADLRRNEIHEREWSATEFVGALREFFPTVKLYDYTLKEQQSVETRVTPLIAVATK